MRYIRTNPHLSRKARRGSFGASGGGPLTTILDLLAQLPQYITVSTKQQQQQTLGQEQVEPNDIDKNDEEKAATLTQVLTVIWHFISIIMN